MTEAEWLACKDPGVMLEFLDGHGKRLFYLPPRVSDRKRVLLFCAFCHQLWEFIRPAPLRDVVRIGERFADEQAPAEEWNQVRDASIDYLLRTCPPHGTDEDPVTSAAELMASRCGVLSLLARDLGKVTAAMGREGQSVKVTCCDLIRCAISSPNFFRPVAFSLEWRTSTAVALAGQMYESRDFGAMPILADALQDAGCDNEEVLNHCRGPGPHVRGCWVVDLVLGKE
jgi:hypothetical protein